MNSLHNESGIAPKKTTFFLLLLVSFVLNGCSTVNRSQIFDAIYNPNSKPKVKPSPTPRPHIVVKPTRPNQTTSKPSPAHEKTTIIATRPPPKLIAKTNKKPPRVLNPSTTTDVEEPPAVEVARLPDADASQTCATLSNNFNTDFLHSIDPTIPWSSSPQYSEIERLLAKGINLRNQCQDHLKRPQRLVGRIGAIDFWLGNFESAKINFAQFSSMPLDRGVKFSSANMFKKSIRTIDQILRICSHRPKLLKLYQEADLYFYRGQYDRALPHYETIINPMSEKCRPLANHAKDRLVSIKG